MGFKENKKHGFTLLEVIIALAVVLLLSGAYVKLTRGSISKTPTSTVSSQQGWVEYNNQKYGFGLNYPKGWTLNNLQQYPEPDPSNKNIQTDINVFELNNGEEKYYNAEKGGSSVTMSKYLSSNVGLKKVIDKDYLVTWFEGNKGLKSDINGSYDDITINEATILDSPSIIQTAKLIRTPQDANSEDPVVIKRVYFVMDNVIWSFNFTTPFTDMKKQEVVFDALVQSFHRTK